MKIILFSILSMFLVNGQQSSMAAGAQPLANHPSSNQASSYLYKVHDDAFLGSGEFGQSQAQAVAVDKEKERLDQLQEELNAKERELALLRDRSAAAAKLLNVEKSRAETLEAQLNQKEQELSVLCNQRDTHQEISLELNRTKSSLDRAREQVVDMEQQVAVNNDYVHQAARRIAELDRELTVKEQDLKLAKANVDKMTLMLVDLDKDLNDRNADLTHAKKLLAGLGRSLPKQAKSAPVAAAVPNSGNGKVNENIKVALRDDLKRGSVAVRQRGEKLTFALASWALFARGQATMTPAGTSLIGRIGTALNKVPYQSIEVAGHTDDSPVKYSPRRPYRDNEELSRARAEHAGQALISAGLGADRVKMVGYAATKPVASNSTEEGRSKNRRVEIIVMGPSSAPMVSSGEKIEQVGSSTRVASEQKAMIQKVVTR